MLTLDHKITDNSAKIFGTIAKIIMLWWYIHTNIYIYIYIYIYIHIVYCLCWEFLEKTLSRLRYQINIQLSRYIAIIINTWPFLKGRPSVWRFSVSCPPYFCSDENEKLFVNVYIYKQICIFDTFTTINILTTKLNVQLVVFKKVLIKICVFVLHLNCSTCKCAY